MALAAPRLVLPASNTVQTTLYSFTLLRFWLLIELLGVLLDAHLSSTGYIDIEPAVDPVVSN